MIHVLFFCCHATGMVIGSIMRVRGGDVKFDSGNDDVTVGPGIDPIELTQNQTRSSSLQKFPQYSNLGPLKNP